MRTSGAGDVEPETWPPELSWEAPEELAHRSLYSVMGFRAEVASSSAAFIATLDRMNAFFRVDGDPGDIDGRYEAIGYGPDQALSAQPGALAGPAGSAPGQPGYAEEGLWELTFQDEDLAFREGLVRAVSHLEWHLCEQAIARRNDLLHVHGAALSGPIGSSGQSGQGASVLLPGRSGIGKTTFALALALRGREQGVRLLSDDVVFLHTGSWAPESFPRAFHVHDDALPRLEPLGLRYAPEDHIGAHLCSTVLDTWEARPGAPLRYVVFPHLDPDGPIALEPISGAEATVELMRYSKNLRRFPRHGLDLVPRLLSQTECYVLRRNDDLAAAADVVLALLAR